MKNLSKILIANRGEIAVRIIKTANKLNIKTVAVYSPADSDALHVKLANEAYNLESNELSESYLNIEKLIKIALKSQCLAVHAGYGFLSENPKFVKACKENNLVFIGPYAKVMELMGNKIKAREFIKSIQVPLVEGITGTIENLLQTCTNLGFPILIKSAAGGGGKGMRIVWKSDDLKLALESTQREALAYFGDSEVFIEKYIENPRHIEVQILADSFGNVIHLFERECSIQRRYQKIIEEAPSPTLNAEMRKKITNAAVSIALATNYVNAGTIEFLTNADGSEFYFLEMNTRIQVEHPVTEMITGIDIVEEQIKIAQGEALTFSQSDIKLLGHSIECRIYAENTFENFMPAPGNIQFYSTPQNIRIDSAIEKPQRIEPFYDPMISKIIAFGNNRKNAINQMISSLEKYIVLGLETNISYLNELLLLTDFSENNISTHFCSKHNDLILSNIKLKKQKIDKSILVLLFHLFQTETNKKHLWQKIQFYENLKKTYKIENDFITLFFENRNNFLVNEKKYNFKNFHRYSNQISIEVNNEHIKAQIFNTSEEHYIHFENHFFKILSEKEFYENSIYENQSIQKQADKNIKSHIPGKVIKIYVQENQEIKEGEALIIIESMKMENTIKALSNGKIKSVLVSENQNVDKNKILIEIE
jgi:3-methylcrotonyl-CoA carboxylase alpha subunit